MYNCYVQDSYIYFVVKNDCHKDRMLTFTSSQQFEVIVHKSDEVVYKYSDDRFFAQVYKTIELKPGDEIEYKLFIEKMGLTTGEVYCFELYSTSKELLDEPHCIKELKI